MIQESVLAMLWLLFGALFRQRSIFEISAFGRFIETIFGLCDFFFVFVWMDDKEVVLCGVRSLISQTLSQRVWYGGGSTGHKSGIAIDFAAAAAAAVAAVPW